MGNAFGKIPWKWVYLFLAGFIILTGGAFFWRQGGGGALVSSQPQAPEASQAPPVADPPAKSAGNDLVKNISDSTFTKEVNESEKPVLVDFWATWCGPCRMFGPIVDQVAADYGGRLKVCRVDVDQNPKLSQAFQIRAIPTSILVKNGKVVKMWVGLVSGDDLKAEVDKVLQQTIKQKGAKT